MYILWSTVQYSSRIRGESLLLCAYVCVYLYVVSVFVLCRCLYCVGVCIVSVFILCWCLCCVGVYIAYMNVVFYDVLCVSLSPIKSSCLSLYIFISFLSCLFLHLGYSA